jgi:hypothetical protein
VAKLNSSSGLKIAGNKKITPFANTLIIRKEAV